MTERTPSDLTSEEVDEQIQIALEDGGSLRGVAQDMGVTEWRVRRVKQRMLDEGRISRAKDRKTHRSENAIIALNRELLQVLDSIKPALKRKRKQPKQSDEDVTGVLHLSDLHFNEVIQTADNKFDFQVASLRLAKLVNRATSYFKANGISRVVMALGGDMMNSDRRLDEVLTSATNRSRAVVIGATLLANVVLDMADTFDVSVLAITGNEGRAKQELCFSDPGVTDSYDASIYWMMEAMLSDSEGISMLGCNGNAQVFSVSGKTFLLLHGHQVKAQNQKDIQAIVGRYAQAMDTKIDIVICGHIHACLIGDVVARSSSLCGSNAYSGDGLQFSSRASQNLHIARPCGIESIKIDLQDTDGVAGYDIDALLSQHRTTQAGGSNEVLHHHI